ncbi:MBL fold metallo-hydrolase [Kocuria rhizophila]|nr:MBL fold metallo-hydrolase [Kocuria rhizophila]
MAGGATPRQLFASRNYIFRRMLSTAFPISPGGLPSPWYSPAPLPAPTLVGMIATQTEVIELARITVRRISVSEMDNNVYLLTSKSEGAQVSSSTPPTTPVRSRAWSPPATGDCSDWGNLQLIVTTHSHWDACAPLEAWAARRGHDRVRHRGQAIIAVPIGPHLRDGDTAKLGTSAGGSGAARARPRLDRPGLPGSRGPRHIFTGDSLFPGGAGESRLPRGLPPALPGRRRARLDRFDDDTVIHPGHGEPTTLGAERPHLREWEERGW